MQQIEPLLPWLVAGMSAFLLVMGGFMLARTALMRRIERMFRRERELTAQMEATISECMGHRQRAARGAEVEATRKYEVPASRIHDDFGEGTALPPPVGFFEPAQAQPQAPRLERVSDGEYAIEDAALPEQAESQRAAAASADAHKDETRQFNLHSPDAVVHFLERIDQLSDENRELRVNIVELNRQLQEQRTEGGEQVQRLAALDSTTTMLKEELRRRGARIKQLEEQLGGEIRAGGALRAEAAQGAPGQAVQLRFVAEQQGGLRHTGAPMAPDEPTLRVQRLGESELGHAPPAQGKKRIPGE
ncbi:MAG: hypothetical protein RBU30_14680 [Polyangia bacterium]|jgi:ribosomal protein S6E (S10)|nr:hypothetical protein [Polyangia bacterium]